MKVTGSQIFLNNAYLSESVDFYNKTALEAYKCIESGFPAQLVDFEDHGIPKECEMIVFLDVEDITPHVTLQQIRDLVKRELEMIKDTLCLKQLGEHHIVTTQFSGSSEEGECCVEIQFV